jgi:hypothetical protein
VPPGPENPYGDRFFIPLDQFVAGGLSSLDPGQSFTFQLRFVREKERTFRYEVRLYGAVQATHPPTIAVNPLVYDVVVGQSLEIQVLADDPDGDVVSLFAEPQLEHSTFTAQPGETVDGRLIFQPQSGQAGNYMIGFTARDPSGLFAKETVLIKVHAPNRPPVISVRSEAEVKEGEKLTLPINISDPDGDLLTLSSDPLPANGLLIPAVPVLEFAPGFDQAGQYILVFRVSDGIEEAEARTVIRVEDVPVGGPEDPQGLTLEVDPVENPTLLGRTRISGRVNVSGTPSGKRLTSALITGMSPAGAGQGETLDVTLTGLEDGGFPTHFQSGVSQADFGAGIRVESTRVSSPFEAVVRLVIDADATLGPRVVRIMTGDETAIGLQAFQVSPGTTRVFGSLVDPDSGAPLIGAVVTVEGTNFSTITGENGSFNITGLPAGLYRLLVNPVNHEFLRLPLDVVLGQPIELGTVEARSTVFDPSAPPSATLLSVLGRKAAFFPDGMSRSDIRGVVMDGLMLVGRDQIGIVDEYGNQCNPEAGESPAIMLDQAGVDILVGDIERGESIPLHEILFALNFGLKWEDGVPITLDQWMETLQELVDRAWTDPSRPENALPILVFSRTGYLSPDPPKLSPYVRLNPLQAFLLQASYWTYLFETP